MNTVKKDIINILKGYFHSDYSFNIESDLNDILDCSNSLSIGPIVGYALNKSDKYKTNIFDNTVFLAADRYERQNSIRQEIINILNKNNIPYIFLKGHTLSKYYDEEHLRYSTDIDILVKKNDYDLVKHILVDEYSYKLIIYKTNEFNVSKNSIVLDMQNKLTEDDEIVDKIYDDIIFDNTHELNNEYKYLFIITHAAKHLNTNYISIQFLLDLYYVNKLDLDREFINSKLKEIKLDRFNEVCLKTIDVLFNGADSDDTIDSFIEYMFNSSGIENRILAHDGDNYIISRLFPDAKTMCLLYPSLAKCKLLLPIYYIKRLIDRISMGRLNNAINEVKISNSVDNNEVIKINELFKKIGLR